MLGLPRDLTPDEKVIARSTWPKMNVERVVVTGEKNPQYNCLAWTLGITNAWVWPWGSRNATKAEFDMLYGDHGYSPGSNGPIAAFGLSLNAMTHGSVSGAGHGTRWESKSGAWLRIQHGLGEMEGGTEYGKVQGYYTQARGGKAMTPSKPTKLRKEELAILRAAVQHVDKTLANQFERAYIAWKKDWEHPAILMSSNPVDRIYSVHFRQILLLGPAVLPLLLQNLQKDEDDFFALQAVDRLMPHPLVVSYQPGDPAILQGEQGRARETVRRWIAYSA